jgi:hypothetical protein
MMLDSDVRQSNAEGIRRLRGTGSRGDGADATDLLAAAQRALTRQSGSSTRTTPRFGAFKPIMPPPISSIATFWPAETPTQLSTAAVEA